MKPHLRVLDVQSTVQVAEDKQVKMSIEEGAMAHIMGILTDLYSDPEMAVLREYATNAADAHVDAGTSLPIEVTLPTTLSPYLKIRDYGNGLAIDDIRNIYSRYGASTKRETNDQVGSLGLGCKSALTYTDQFTLQGIKDGIATQVAISRDEDGAGSMTIVSEYETDETSGVEITVPAKGYNDFEEKARYLFQFWPKGSVLVNGEEPEQIEGIELESGLYVVSKDKLNQSVVVMGNVPYPFRNDDQSYFSVVAYVEMGAVQFTPSREELQMTTRTKNVVADIGTRVVNLKESAAQRLVDEATSKPEALVAALHASRLFRFNGLLTYKGKEIPTEVIKQERENDFLVCKQNAGYRGRSVSAESRLPTSIFPTTLFFTGFTNKGLNSVQREKIAYFLKENSINTEGVTQYVLLDQLRYSSWVEKGRIVNWESVKELKLPRQSQTQSGRPVGAYDVIKPDRTYTEVTQAEELVGVEHIFWFPYGNRIDVRVRDLLQTEYPNCLIVELKENRIGKFERVFPQARRVFDAAKDLSQAWFDGLTENQRMFLSVHKMDNCSYYAQLDETKLDDPALKAIVKQAKKKNPALLEKARRFTYFYQGDLDEIKMEAYPLLDFSVLRYTSDDRRAFYLNHLYLYLNAVFSAQQSTASLTVSDAPVADSTDEKENNS